MSGLPPGARAVVVTASNRASSGVYEDRSGRVLADGLVELGFAVDGPQVLPDDADQLEAVLRAAVDAGVDVVLTTGGTGLSPTDVTPEATRRVLEREAPGLAEAVRRYGVENGVPTSVLSRGLAGTAGRTLLVNLPGSTGGVRDALAVLGPLLPHVVSQLRGGDHDRPAGEDRPGLS
jgi:molybdenum cofactor synthesis domain-containing protein